MQRTAFRLLLDERLYPWFRLLLRAALALPMIASGIARVIPVQMPAPLPVELLQRLGELTPMRLLWTLIGASPVFESFTGLAGLAGGLLLLLPRTTLLGALVCGANLLMAVTLSLCYDLPFKLYLLHLLLISVLLIAPDLRRLADLFLLDRTVEPAEEPRLGRAPEVLLLLLAFCVIGWSVVEAARRYPRLNPPKPPFYGAWTVEELAVDGEDVPLSTDANRWRYVIFQDPGALDVELMIGSRKRYALDLDMSRRTMTLGRRAKLSFVEPEDSVLLLAGSLDGRRLHAKLRRMQLNTPWFHWLLGPEIYE